MHRQRSRRIGFPMGTSISASTRPSAAREEGDQASRPISTGQLSASQRVHFRPINLVVFEGASGDCSREKLS